MKTEKYDIYIGCKDKETYAEDTALAYIKTKTAELFSESEMGFSLTAQLGGYVHTDGTYITENSLKITLIGNLDETELGNFIDAVKKDYNQESVLVVKKDIDTEYIKDGQI